MNNMFWVWLAIAIIMAFIEGTTPTLVTIWFMFGAVVSMLAAWLGASPQVQWILFIAVSIILLIVTRPVAKRLLSKLKTTSTNADRIIGQTGIVTEEIDGLKNSGQIMALGQCWSAKSESGNVIGEGEMVIITEISGVKAIVKKLEN